jgi:hypothetical protein
MIRFNERFHKLFWFIGGFALGYTLISLGHAAIPNTTRPATRNTLASEITGSKVTSPTFDDDFASLNQVEGKYAENWDQQQRLRQATGRTTRALYSPKKKTNQ